LFAPLARYVGLLWLVVFSLVFQWIMAANADALEVPPLAGRVNDGATLLRAEQREALEQKLAAYERGAGHQFALLTIPTLDGDAIEDFSLRVVEKWQLGRADADDGLLMLIVPGDRRMRIEVGYGLEGAIPDALAGRIIRNVLAPAFRSEQYFAGIDRAFDLLIKAAGGQAVDVPAAKPRPSSSSSSGEFLLVLFAALIAIVLGSSRRGGGGGALLLGSAMMGMGRHRRGGFGGGGFGGGGFGGGGGGFGGGGASGGW